MRAAPRLDHLVVQDLFLTKTAELADVVLPGLRRWAESEGTVTSSERRVQRVRKALDPPGEARDDIEIVYELAKRLGTDLGSPRRRGRLERGANAVADARRDDATSASTSSAASSGRAGTRSIPATSSCTRVSGTTSSRSRAPFMPVEHSPPVDLLDDDFPLRLTTGRRLESFNTGVQTGGYESPLHVGGEALLVLPRTARATALVDGGRALVTSRRGAVEAPVAFDDEPAPRARVHEPALPRPRRDERAHDRRDRPASRAPQSSRRRRSAWRRSSGPAPPRRRADRCRAGGDRHGRRRGSGRATASRAPTGHDGICSSPRSAPRSAVSAGLARARSATRRGGSTVPPADAYGVASFYALLALEERPADVTHVCTDLSCALEGRTRSARRAREPVPRPLRARAGLVPHDRRRRAARGAAAGEAPPLPQPGEPGLRLLRRIGAGVDPDVARRVLARRRLRALGRARELGADGRDPRGERVAAARPRRRGVPDRRQVGGGRASRPRSRTTSSATPTSRSRARSRTAS